MTEGRLTINDYLRVVKETDRLPKNDLSSVLHGLFGEVGGIMAAAKKLKREPDIYSSFDKVILEEFGDAFWYLCCLSLRIGVDMVSVFLNMPNKTDLKPDIILGNGSAPMSFNYSAQFDGDFDNALVKLGQLTGDFLSAEYILTNSEEKAASFLTVFFHIMGLLQIDFGQVININIDKISGRFIRPVNSKLPTFDCGFPEFERLPEDFEVEFVERTPTQQAMRINGIFVGDPLTDNIEHDDGYRFHDVFHFSYAAMLHWSPTFRSLLKQKRKSDLKIDEEQDGGRAIVVEEGVAAWVFTIAKENNLFKGQTELSFDMLKNIAQFVKGYEVERCPLILWEETIIKGFEVFRAIMANNGGKVVGSRKERTIQFKKIGISV